MTSSDLRTPVPPFWQQRCAGGGREGSQGLCAVWVQRAPDRRGHFRSTCCDSLAQTCCSDSTLSCEVTCQTFPGTHLPRQNTGAPVRGSPVQACVLCGARDRQVMGSANSVHEWAPGLSVLCTSLVLLCVSSVYSLWSFCVCPTAQWAKTSCKRLFEFLS